jgi:hypothetical protein
MKWQVIAGWVDPYANPIALHDIRTETIDTRTNPIFGRCKGPWDVEDAYEAFWNRLNMSDEEKGGTHLHEKVVVVLVRRAK